MQKKTLCKKKFLQRIPLSQKNAFLQKKRRKLRRKLKTDVFHAERIQKIAREAREKDFGVLFHETSGEICQNLRQALVKIQGFRAGGPILFFRRRRGGSGSRLNLGTPPSSNILARHYKLDSSRLNQTILARTRPCKTLLH